jgi:hypothetical protein
MDIKRTRGLTVYIDNGLAVGELVIHPNDGFDLGLINTQHPVSICNQTSTPGVNSSSHHGKILLKNSCRSGTLQMSQKQWELMGKEKSVALLMKTDTVFIVSQQARQA